ncbi:hypothetical protein Tco_0388814 [Tanacetum coccineum]
MIYELLPASPSASVVLDLQRVPVEWSHIPVVTASMSKSAQAAPVGYGRLFVMLPSLPVSCGPPVASLKSQSDSYGQLPATVVPMPPGKPEPPDLAVMQSHSVTAYHKLMP